IFPGTLNNSGLYDIQADVTFFRNFLVAVGFNNTGTLRKSAGTGTASINIPFTGNGGTVDSESGNLTIAGGSHTNGRFSAGISGNPQAVVQLAGDHIFSGTFTGTGSGSVQWNGSTFTAGPTGATLNFPPSLFRWISGVVDGGT